MKDKCDAAAVAGLFGTLKKKQNIKKMTQVWKKHKENRQKTWQLESEHAASGGPVEASLYQ